MAGNLAALRNYFDNTAGFPIPVREAIITDHGIQSLDDFTDFEDKDIHDLCVSIRRGSSQANPGIPVGLPHEIRLRQIRWYSVYMTMVQRQPNPAHATLQRLKSLWEIWKKIENEKESEGMEPPEKMEKVEDARKAIEDIDEYLARTRNAKGVPLAYLTRDNVNAPALGDDPGFATPSYDEEMIRRASHAS
eukprot:scaffold9133_cov208-Cylindrotheca_fusiformis.AAC.1